MLEGLDGAGTTTQAQLLVRQTLVSLGIEAHATAEPSRGPIGMLIRQILAGRVVGVREQFDRSALALLFAADRLDHARSEVLPTLRSGKWVVSDRYVLSSLAYQALDLPQSYIAAINTRAPRPDLTLFLDVPADVSLRRKKAQAPHPDLFEDLATQRRVARHYQSALKGIAGVDLGPTASHRRDRGRSPRWAPPSRPWSSVAFKIERLAAKPFAPLTSAGALPHRGLLAPPGGGGYLRRRYAHGTSHRETASVIDPSRFEDLHIVRKVKETIRKWWRIELSFADADGQVVDHGKGRVMPRHSQFCDASLANPAGFGLCLHSIEEAVKRLADGSDHKAVLVDSCHMGFHIMACPIRADGKFHGAIFTCGFLQDEARSSRTSLIPANARREGLTVLDPDRAYGAIPSLPARDMSYFKDLLETTVAEIVEFSRTVDQKEQKEARIAQLSRELGGRYQFANIVGKSPAMQRLFGVLEKVVDSDATVLITGENGTGKELIARALHYNGPRRNRPFVAQNCSAFNDNLLESELFGHVRGSFTGANRDKLGLFKIADGGTFFLDEVGDMSPAMQVKLLRVLQEGTFLPVGAVMPDHVEVRIIAATNQPLPEMVKRRQFREDLYYRLNVLNIEVPPLRTRLEDLPMLCEHFLSQQAKRAGRPLKRLDPEVLARLYSYSWPGNIRELENEIERLVVLSGDKEVITPDFIGRSSLLGADPRLLSQGPLPTGELRTAVQSLEREMIRRGLVQTHSNKTKLADQLGVSRTTLIKKIKEYGIDDSG